MCPHGTFWFFNGEKEASVFRLINGNKQMKKDRGTPWRYEQLGCRKLGAASVGLYMRKTEMSPASTGPARKAVHGNRWTMRGAFWEEHLPFLLPPLEGCDGFIMGLALCQPHHVPSGRPGS